MTEQEWLACDDLRPMLQLFRVKSNARKLRLFVRACCGLVAHLMEKEALLVLEVAERYADGAASPSELYRVRDAARQMEKRYKRELHRPEECRIAAHAARLAGNETIARMALEAVNSCRLALVQEACGDNWRAWPAPTDSRYTLSEFIPLLREVFGNPFCPSRFAPAWRTLDVFSLAQAAYEERFLPSGELDPVRLAILADALEEVGASEDIILHLRSPEPHVKGCWALDRILGKG
jgi:hypothetical protein